jgi:SAM-dependent methyltransferase
MEFNIKLQKDFFEDTHHLMTANNHFVHNDDPEYWNILLKEIKDDPSRWEGKVALDFGCGCGRNLKNLLDLADWSRVDGCDISKKNSNYAKEWMDKQFDSSLSRTWETSGDNIQPCEENTYDFVMSHVVFQHIASYQVRLSILKDIFRSLKPNGLVSLHFMDLGQSVDYYSNYSGNLMLNCRVENPSFLVKDFEEIGFKNVTCEVGKDFFNPSIKTYYIKGTK